MLPIHYAALKGYLSIVELLLKFEESKNGEEGLRESVNACQIDNLTPVLYACHSGSMHILQLLLEAGGDINVMSKKGVTALHLAAAGGHVQVVQFLINEKNLDPNCKSHASHSKPIHVASSGGHLEIIKFMVEEVNCDPCERDKNSEDCLSLAIKSKKKDVANYLIKTGKFDLLQVLELKGFNYFAYALVKG